MPATPIQAPLSNEVVDNSPGESRRICLERLPDTAREVLFRFRCLPVPGFDYINPAITNLTGYSPEEYYQDADLFLRTIHFADLKILRKILKGFEAEQPVHLRWIHRNGTQFWVEMQWATVPDAQGNVMALEGIVRHIPIPTKKRAEEGLSLQRKRLLQLSQSLASNFSVNEIVRHILQTLEELLVFNHCTFWIKADEPILRRLFDRVQTEYVSKNVQIKALSESSSMFDVLRDGKAKNFREEHVLMIPIQTSENKMGVFTADRHYGLPFTDEEFELSQMCITYASLAIDNAHLCKKVDTQTNIFKRLSPSGEAMTHPFTLNEIGEAIGEEAISLSGADRVAIFAIRPDYKVTRLWSRGLSANYLDRVLSSRNTFLENKVFQHQEMREILNIQSIPETSPARLAAQVEGYQSMVICPLVFSSQTIASVVCYFNKPHHLAQDEIDNLRLFSRQAAITLENTRLYEELEDSYLQTVLTLARTIDARDAYTADHSRRLADWAEETAKRLDCSDEELQVIRWAALLHDIGKIGIPDAILRKAGPLTEEEWQVMRQHPTLGAEIIAPAKYLQPISSIILHHQEKYDGTGYPDGLQGEEIPLAARIITVVDAYGAMTDERIYRRARTREEATAELQRCAGTHFDSKIVNVFSELITSEYTM